MVQRRTFINKAIFWNNIKRCGWLGTLYTIILLIIVPLQLSLSNYRSYDWLTDILYFRNSLLQRFLVLVAPVTIGNLLFSYLQEKNYSDMMHSLPLSRTELFKTNVVSGTTLLVLPIILTCTVTVILNPILKLQGFYSLSDVLQWCFVSILINLVFFLSAAFSSVIAESIYVQVILSYVIILLPAGLITLVKANTNILLHGFIADGSNNIYPSNGILLPVVRIIRGFDYSTDTLRIVELFSYVAMLVILYYLTKYFYSKRQLEDIFTTISFRSIQFIFKHVITLSSMLLVGVLYFDLQWSIASKLSLGYLIGSFSGYYASEMLFQRSVLVFKNIKGYSIYGLIILAGFIFMK